MWEISLIMIFQDSDYDKNPVIQIIATLSVSVALTESSRSLKKRWNFLQ